MMYERTQGPLPQSAPGGGWVVIDQYVNTDHKDAIQTTRQEELNLLLYGLPAFLAAVSFGFGRLVASGAPRYTGASGSFAISSFCALIAFPALVTAFILNWMENLEGQRYAWVVFQQISTNEKFAWTAFLIAAVMGEILFLNALTACGASLKRGTTARAVGFIVFLYAVLAFILMVGWNLYKKEFRPKQLTDDWLLYEQAALMVGWLFMALVYWRAVRSVRSSAREYMDSIAPAA